MPIDYIDVENEVPIALVSLDATTRHEPDHLSGDDGAFDTDGEHTLVDLEIAVPNEISLGDTSKARSGPNKRERRKDTDELGIDDLRLIVGRGDSRGRGPGSASRGVAMQLDPEENARTARTVQKSTSMPLPAPRDRASSDLTSPGDTTSKYRSKSAAARPAGPSRVHKPQPDDFVRPITVRDAVPVGIASDAGWVDTNAPLRVPVIGGRYRIIERVGSGGMGKVFKVVHARLGKTFALKIISDALAGQNKARELFYREARTASSLSHPNVTSVVDYGEDEAVGAFMVMEFLQGQVLSERLSRDKRLSVRQAGEILRQVAEALEYIHSKGIVHCDIKTENILLTEVPAASKRNKLQVKLLDFGLARSMSTGHNTASVAGTPHYVAPERLRGEQASPSNDIYALGILLYELLTGRVPWDGTVDEILRGHLALDPTPPSRLIEGGLDPAMENLVLRALAKNPASRHKNIAAFLYELQTVMDMLGYSRPKRGRKRLIADDPAQRTVSQRDKISRALFDASRIPMALISRSGEILVANPSFARFIMGVAVDVEGMHVQSTTLVGAWESFEHDLARACDGKSVRHTIKVDTESRRPRRLVMWLDPGLNEDQAIFGAHPMTS